MSDIKPLNLGSLVSKKTRRAKERLLQNFGKADKTTDEMFEVYQINFNGQQTNALNLQKQVKHYLTCLKELHEASKSLSQCLLDIHERDWPKHDVYENNAYEMDHINEDLEDKLKQSVLVPLEQYLSQFTEVREKIAKRGRKLVDYDSIRHAHESLVLQQQASKQPDDNKLAKSRDQLEDAKKVYESLNNDLHEELPSLFDNRLPFMTTILQRLFESNITYHQDHATNYKGYLETVELLAKAIGKGKYISSLTTLTSTSTTNNTNLAIKNNKSKDKTNDKTQPQQEANQSSPTNTDNGGKHQDKFYSCNNGESSTATNIRPTSGANKGPVYLNKVQATYRYVPEDDDELSFEAGEIIQVIEYEDPSEQEEGWLMGIKQSDGKKGLFPANFTKEINT